MPTQKNYKLVPVGGKMNDGAYPFRGEHRLPDGINHGHSGVQKVAPTSLLLRITGSNLVIEELQAAKGNELKCELAVDGSVPRPVSLSSSRRLALAVPGDGREYELTAVVKGEQARHFCRLALNGSEGRTVLRLRAPSNCGPDAVCLVADGKRLHPVAGWYSVPLHAEECGILVNVPELSLTGFGPGGAAGGGNSLLGEFPSLLQAGGAGLGGGQRESLVLPKIQTVQGTLGASGLAPATMQSFIFEAVPSPSGTLALQCVGSGQLVPLTLNEPVAVASAGGPFRVCLPGGSPEAGAASSPATAAGGGASVLVNSPSASGVPPTAAGAGSAGLVPELETRVSYVNGTPTYVAAAKDCFVQITAESGAVVSGYGIASLPLPHRNEQRVRLTLTDANGRTLLRQTAQVPAMQHAPVIVRLQDEPAAPATPPAVTGGGGAAGVGNVLVVGAEGSTVSIGGGPKANGTAGIRVPAQTAQSVTVEQTNPDGSVSAVTLNLGARTVTPAAPTFSPPPPVSVAPPTPAVDTAWVAQLAQVVQTSNLDEARQQVQLIRPPNPAATSVVGFVHEQLFKPAPTIAFVAQKDVLTAVQCPGHNLAASVASQPTTLVPMNGTVQVPPGASVTLTAESSKNGAPVAACRVQLVGSATTADVGDEQVVARLLDALQRHNMDPQRVADDLAGINLSTMSPTGQRLIPLLLNCLRRALAPSARRELLFFTCGNGFLDNIYTEQPQLQLTAAVDGQAAAPVPQRGRVPAIGILAGQQPHFVKLVAKDPATGSVITETTVTLMGPETSGDGRGSPSAAPRPSASFHFTGPDDGSHHVSDGSVLHPSRSTALVGGVESSANAGAEGSGTGPVTLPYLDATLQQVGSDVQLRFISPPHLRIVCDVDGIGGDTGRSDVVTKVGGGRFHRVELSLVDRYGRVVFQQRLEVPPMSSPAWGVALQDSGLALDPDAACTATVSVDRAPERAVQGNLVTFDTASPHYVLLRKYLNGLHGLCTGELGIRLPAGVSLKELEELVKLLRNRIAGTVDDGALKSELQAMRVRCGAPMLRDLISALIEVWSSMAPRSSGSNEAGRVYFRLTGSE